MNSANAVAVVLISFLIGNAAVRASGPTTIPTVPEEQTVDLCTPAPPLKVIKWFKGNPVEEFKPGQIYVVEFWATWCVPCRQSIPHLSELTKNFENKVTFIGVDVWEQPDDSTDSAICAKVDKFVQEMGDKMAYNVAADGSDHFMFRNWLLAAHRMNIPSAFIVGKDGKIAWIGHPLKLDSVLDQVVSGAWDAQAELARLQKERAADKRQRALMSPSLEAYESGDFKTAVARLDAMLVDNRDMADDPQVMNYRFTCLIHSDQASAFLYLRKLYDDNVFQKYPQLAYGITQAALQNANALQHSDYFLLLAAMDVGRRDGNNSHTFLFMPPYAETLFRDGQIERAVQVEQKIIADATPNIGHDVSKDWVDEQTKRLDEFKASLH